MDGRENAAEQQPDGPAGGDGQGAELGMGEPNTFEPEEDPEAEAGPDAGAGSGSPGGH